jgi:cellulose synthase/poly-beta-1,6-N-acetylglucosamine synthase-like glycosyltransferase
MSLAAAWDLPSVLAAVLLGAALAVPLYAYVVYPALLRLFTLRRPPVRPPDLPAAWPTVTIVLAAYNEEAQLPDTLETLLALDYPPERRWILVVSDASTDRTDRIAADLASRGVELLRMPRRSGKTAAENAALARIRTEIVVNTDASTRLHPGALKALVRRMGDPSTGVVSGRDVSVGAAAERDNAPERGYVGYEMWVRDLETRFSGIVGASGCLYAIRAALHKVPIPEHLSRDFMAALTARRHGLRAVSAPDALCFVPRTASLRQEHRRKVRTIVRGMQTLLDQGRQLDPRRDGAFAWMLFSHKVCRWLAGWSPVAAALALAVLAPGRPWAALALAGLVVTSALGALAWWWPASRPIPSFVALAGYVVSGHLAACRAAVRVLSGGTAPVWEPTRRTTSRRVDPA